MLSQYIHLILFSLTLNKYTRILIALLTDFRWHGRAILRHQYIPLYETEEAKIWRFLCLFNNRGCCAPPTKKEKASMSLGCCPKCLLFFLHFLLCYYDETLTGRALLNQQSSFQRKTSGRLPAYFPFQESLLAKNTFFRNFYLLSWNLCASTSQYYTLFGWTPKNYPVTELGC